jgi:hypothetical protein
MLRAGLREGSPASARPVSSVVAAPGPGSGHYFDRARVCGGFGLQRKKAIIDGDGQGWHRGGCPMSHAGKHSTSGEIRTN